ncbi:MAG: hypothetical protein ABR969_06290 [Sedimentisphaerales bacterium]
MDKFTRYPVISLSAEYLVMGHLLRRNIMTYKAPQFNEGYDLICTHPDPRKKCKRLRIQVKSRMATDCDRGFPVKGKTIGSFDFLIVAFLNIGYFFRKRNCHNYKTGRKDIEFYTFPPSFIKKHHDKSSSWEKVRTRGLNIERYKNEAGFENIAKALKIEYPRKLKS